MQEDDGGEVAPPTLQSLPQDCLNAIAATLSMADLCHLLATSHQMLTVFRRDELWSALAAVRFPSAAAAVGCMHYSDFPRIWSSSMDVIDDAVRTLCSALVRSPAMAVARSVASPDSPTAMSMAMSPAATASARGVDGVIGADLGECAAVLRRSMTPPVLADWVATRMASGSPIGCLAVLKALRDQEIADEGLHVESGFVWSADLGVRAAPLPSLFARVTLRWSTWSQLRDCRGFRARDDVHRLSSRLVELCARPEFDLEFWTILQRGVCDEVRAIHLLPE